MMPISLTTIGSVILQELESCALNCWFSTYSTSSASKYIRYNMVNQKSKAKYGVIIKIGRFVL